MLTSDVVSVPHLTLRSNPHPRLSPRFLPSQDLRPSLPQLAVHLNRTGRNFWNPTAKSRRSRNIGFYAVNVKSGLTSARTPPMQLVIGLSTKSDAPLQCVLCHVLIVNPVTLMPTQAKQPSHSCEAQAGACQ